MSKLLSPTETARESGYLPHIAYDSVVFGFDGERLKILIMEYHNTRLFALPGGFIRCDESLDQAVRRGLAERTGLTDIYLEQFYTFGSLERYVPEVMHRILESNMPGFASDHWLLDRFISIGHYALIHYDYVVPRPDALSDSCQWYAIEELPPLILDHPLIVAKALETLRKNVDEKLPQANLLPERFTMKQLQKVYESILGVPLRRTTFQRRMLSNPYLVRHEKQFTGKAHKAPYLYGFRWEKEE